MDTIAIAWNGSISASVVNRAIDEVRLGTCDMSDDPEVSSGLHECKEALMFDGIFYLTDLGNHSTSNKLTCKIFDEIEQGAEPSVCRLARLLQGQLSNGHVWLIFAHDWPREIEVTYYEGSGQELAFYLKLNRGAFKLSHSFKTQQLNVDLDTPLVWALK